ncbi:hypothetical protein ACFTSD_22745 [Nocardiaceae bacterium NPDC056970]
MKTLKNIHDRARNLRKEREDLIEKRRSDANVDPMMTPTERSEYIASWCKEYTRIFAPKFAEIRAEVADYADTTRRLAAKARPHLDADSTAELVRTEQAWRNIVLPQLEKGRTLAAALRNADADAVLGAERFAPAWMQANTPSASGLTGTGDGVDTSIVDRAVSARFAALATSDEGRSAIAAAGTLDAAMPATDRFIDHLETGAGDSLDVALGLSLAMNQSLDVSESDSDAA